MLKTSLSANRPTYLTPEKTAQLFELPVHFSGSKATQISAQSATIEYDIKKTGPNSKAVLYYGPKDCTTYVFKDLKHGSPVEKEIFSKERTWASATPEQKVSIGTISFKLNGLTDNSTYYYRLYVSHDQGKSWDYNSGKFQTR